MMTLKSGNYRVQIFNMSRHWIQFYTRVSETTYGAFTLNVKFMLNENLGDILGGTQYEMAESLMLSEC